MDELLLSHGDTIFPMIIFDPFGILHFGAVPGLRIWGYENFFFQDFQFSQRAGYLSDLFESERGTSMKKFQKMDDTQKVLMLNLLYSGYKKKAGRSFNDCFLGAF